MKVGKMFECVCGEVVYGEEAPYECDSCGKLEKFIELPEEIVKEREEDLVGQEDLREYD